MFIYKICIQYIHIFQQLDFLSKRQKMYQNETKIKKKRRKKEKRKKNKITYTSSQTNNRKEKKLSLLRRLRRKSMEYC
jgi:hypothetical protein